MAQSSTTSQPKRSPRPKPPLDVTPRLAEYVPEGFLAVGRIVGVHGMRGEIKVEPFTDFLERFDPGTILVLGEELEEVEVVSSRPHKNNMLVMLAELHSRNEAELLRGQWLFVPEDEAATLEDNSYWVHDILGMEVVSDAGEALGIVYDVLFTGANEVYVVRSAQSTREILLPAIDEVVLDVDVPAKRMTVHLLPGILD